MSKKIFLLIFLVLILLIVGCENKNNNNKKNVTLIIKSIGNTTIKKYIVYDLTAFQLLSYEHKIKISFGTYLECIDDVCVNKEYVWNFYVNGGKSIIGAKQYKIKDGDRIEFRFGKGGE